MSNLIFPSLPGLMWGIKRTPVWSTVIKRTPSGREFRGRMQGLPRRQYALQFEVLREGGGLAELRQLESFFNEVAGSWGTFLYSDPDDCTALAQGFGIGDGATKAFQLIRSWGGFVEPVYELDGAPALFQTVGGVTTPLAGGYSLESGTVTFSTAPANGVQLTWSGRYFWRCRFLHDSAEFSQFLKGLWEAKKMEFITVKP